MRRHPGLLILLVCSLCVAPSAQAQDQVRVAVAPLDGRGGNIVTRGVRNALDDRAVVVPAREASDAAEAAGVAGASPEGVSRFADAVAAEIVFAGAVETTGGRRRRRRRRQATRATVTLVAYDAGGQELARSEFSYRAGARGRRALEQEVGGLFDQAVAAWEALHAAPEPEPEPFVPDEPIEDPDPEPEPSEAPEDGLAIISGWLGLNVRTRDARIDLMMPGERAYGATYVELGLAAEGRPFAREAGLLRGIYANADFYHSVGLGSVSDDGVTEVSTNFMRLQIMAGYLAEVIPELEIGGGFGGGYEGYHFGPNPIMPTVELGYLRPAARARIRFLQETFVLEVDFGYRGTLGVGAAGDSFGQEDETHGVDVGLGLTGNLYALLDLGFTWAVRFFYVGYFTSYGGMANDVQGTSGAEQSVRFQLMAGWSW